jgi:hypothetical protein
MLIREAKSSFGLAVAVGPVDPLGIALDVVVVAPAHFFPCFPPALAA